MLRRLFFPCATALSLFLCSCGGSSGSGVAAAGVPVDTPPPEVTPPDGTPDDPALEADLRRLAGAANAGPVRAAAPEDADVFELGKMLFFDKVLSGNRDISCYTCHDIDTGTDDRLSVSIGTGGVGDSDERELANGTLIPRNSPPLFHLAGQPTMFWDSRVSRAPDGALTTPEPRLNGRTPAAGNIASHLTSALAAQAVFPPTSREEMRGKPGENEIADATDNLEIWSLLMRRLVGTDDGSSPGIAGYRDLFARAFPDVSRWEDFTFGHAAAAIAAFEIQAFSTRGSRFDLWLAGDPDALTDEEKRGGALFYGPAQCSRCHGGPLLTDGRHHAIGVPQVGPGKDFALEDTGRGLVTRVAADAYRFRTPSLRNVGETGPWMHDGCYTTLEAAVAHYRDPERSLRDYDASQLTPLLQPLVDRDPSRQDARARAISPILPDRLRLDDREVSEIVAFLRSLTDAEALDLEDVEPAEVPSGLSVD